MKIIKRVRYQRVPYSQLEDGDRFYWITTDRIPSNAVLDERYKPCSLLFDGEDTLVPALDTDRYPPEVTWDVVGISERFVDHDDGVVSFDQMAFPESCPESQIETIYE